MTRGARMAVLGASVLGLVFDSFLQAALYFRIRPLRVALTLSVTFEGNSVGHKEIPCDPSKKDDFG